LGMKHYIICLEEHLRQQHHLQTWHETIYLFITSLW
jgi:hypothetical protein